MTRWLPRVFLAVVLVAGGAAIVSTCSGSRSQNAGTLDARTDAPAGTPDAITDGDAATPDAMTDVAGETPDAASDDGICGPGCQVGVAAGCDDYAACLARCQQDFGRGICNPEKSAAQRCVIAIGPDAITCMNGHPYVKSEVCQQERQALTACQRGTPGDAAAD